jgi:acyl-CoA synthetase (AMP-forming)/AMP-acid ligase II
MMRKWGEMGEIVVRSNKPYIMMTCYCNTPCKTLEARRSLWFHSGDYAKRRGMPGGNAFRGELAALKERLHKEARWHRKVQKPLKSVCFQIVNKEAQEPCSSDVG